MKHKRTVKAVAAVVVWEDREQVPGLVFYKVSKQSRARWKIIAHKVYSVSKLRPDFKFVTQPQGKTDMSENLCVDMSDVLGDTWSNQTNKRHHTCI